jgi:hypothetical protein
VSRRHKENPIKNLGSLLAILASIAGILAFATPEIRACLNLDRNALCPFRKDPTPRYGFYINGQSITLSMNKSLIERRLGEPRSISEGILSYANQSWNNQRDGGVIKGADLQIGSDQSGAVDFAGIYLQGDVSSAHAFSNGIRVIPGKTTFGELIAYIPNGQCIVEGYFEGHYGWSYRVFFGPEALQAMSFIALVKLDSVPDEDLLPNLDDLKVQNVWLTYSGYRTERGKKVPCDVWLNTVL